MSRRREPPVVPARDATREDRWKVGKAPGALGWYAGPHGVRVYADLRNGRRHIFFTTWADALAYALRRVYGR